mgnify:CR=1 FL=1
MTDRRALRTRIAEDLSREAEGRPRNLIYFGTAVLFALLAALGFVRQGTVDPFVLLFVTGFAIAALAESLPEGRRRLTLWVRLLAAGVFVVGFLLSVSALLGGPNPLF